MVMRMVVDSSDGGEDENEDGKRMEMRMEMRIEMRMMGMRIDGGEEFYFVTGDR